MASWKAEGSVWECLLYSIICGLEVTATEAAQGGSLTDEGRQSRHEGWAQIDQPLETNLEQLAQKKNV